MNDMEISKAFSRYIQLVIFRKRVDLIRKYKKEQLMIPFDASSINLLLETQEPLEDALDKLTMAEISFLQDFITNEKLKKAIDCLNDRQKQILYLKYIQNYPLAEISRLFGNVSNSAISQQLLTIIKKMHP